MRVDGAAAVFIGTTTRATGPQPPRVNDSDYSISTNEQLCTEPYKATEQAGVLFFGKIGRGFKKIFAGDVARVLWEIEGASRQKMRVNHELTKT